MSDININGRSYGLDVEGALSAKKIKSTDEIKGNQKDDIVIKDKKGQLTDISADKIDIKGSLLKPYFGLPKKGDEIVLFVDEKIEGQVVFSESKLGESLNSENVAKKLNNLGDKAAELNDKVIDKIGEKIDSIKSNPNKTTDGIKDTLNNIADKIDTGAGKAYDTLADAGEKVAKANDKVTKEIGKKIDSFMDDTQTRSSDAETENLLKIDKIMGTKPKDIYEEMGQTLAHTEMLLSSMNNKKFTFGKMETYSERSLDLAVNVGNKAGISANYIFDIQKMDEDVSLTGQGSLIEGPHSTLLFLAQSVEASAFTNEVSLGYKANIGLEFNRPFKKDFSVSLTSGINVGLKDSNPNLSLSSGLEARYQISDKSTLIGGVSMNEIVAGKNQGDAFTGVKFGLNTKF